MENQSTKMKKEEPKVDELILELISLNEDFDLEKPNGRE
jgi:hypothetical protein